ncbi:hypothetical protein TWF506_004120 [Arthrobotrys conoides]|uniref:Uncharacterized protein n=1 Tax=Arthrobotrys conoides TaxID=74498 RepID=A0AAN8N767_9PEZI
MLTSYLLTLPLVLLYLSLTLPPSSAGPLERPSKVATEPPQPITHKLERRPFWPVNSNHELGFLIHCEEPHEIYDRGQERFANHSTEFQSYSGWVSLLYSPPADELDDFTEDQIRQMTSACGDCFCDVDAETDDEMFGVGRGPNYMWCPEPLFNLCKYFFGCYCSLTGPPEPKGSDIALWDYFDDWERTNNEKLPFEWRDRLPNGGPLPPFDGIGGPASFGKSHRTFKQLVPGTKEPWFLEGPSMEDPRDPKQRGDSDLESLWRLNREASGRVWKRDDVGVNKLESQVEKSKDIDAW